MLSVVNHAPSKIKWSIGHFIIIQKQMVVHDKNADNWSFKFHFILMLEVAFDWLFLPTKNGLYERIFRYELYQFWITTEIT